MHVPVARPFMGGREKQNTLEAVEAGELSGTFGRFIPMFENDFANYVGCEYGVAVTNGTTALHAALAAAGVGRGDEVLISTFTNMAPFFAVVYQGARPIPIDIEPDTWNMDPSLLDSKITPKTKAIIPVHIYGHPVNMDPVLRIAEKHNLFVIEDAAEAHGAEYNGDRIGSLGDAGCFSFYANKIITTGEGGMIVTNNQEYANKVRNLASLAYGSRPLRFMHTAVGFNYRMTNLQAGLGHAQLENIDKVIDMKRSIAKFYSNALNDIDGIQLPTEKSYAKNVYWMYHIVLRGDLEGRREQITNFLHSQKIETREAFIPANMQKLFLDTGIVNENDCPIANRIGENGFYLPSGPVISEQELQYVVDNLKKAISL